MNVYDAKKWNFFFGRLINYRNITRILAFSLACVGPLGSLSTLSKMLDDWW